MPTQFDRSYNDSLSEPTYDSDKNEMEFKVKRMNKEILEVAVPRQPNRAEELEYLDWLEDQFWHDSWITLRLHKMMAGPKRWPWKNYREIKNQYQITFMINGIFGGLLTWPLAVWMGRYMQSTVGGIPKVHLPTVIHDWPNAEPTFLARRTFNRYFWGTCVVGGFLFASWVTDSKQYRNQWFNRSDLKPYPAMMPKEL